MAKHSKGKHSKSKKNKDAVKFERSKDNNEESSSNTGEAEGSTSNVDLETSVDSEKKGAHQQDANFSGNEDASSQSPDETTQLDPQVIAEGGFQPATFEIEKKHRDKKKIAKRIGITIGSIVGVLAIAYFAGVWLFSTHFLPNTYISNIDISMQTPAEVQSDFESKVSDYRFKVKGNGLNLSITSAEAGLNIDSVAMTDAISAEQNPWKWPVEIFETRDVSDALTNALSATKLSDLINKEVEKVNENGKDYINATVAYDDPSNSFAVVPEVLGTKLDAEHVLQTVVVAAMNLDPEITITNEDLIQPEILRDDERLASAAKQANELIKSKIKLILAGNPVAEVGADDICAWVSITPEFTAVLDENAMNQWASEMAAKFNTVGSERTYTRPDGKQITVSGGDYGWSVDGSSLTASLIEAIKSGSSEDINIPVLQEGTGYSGVGGQDWGKRYIDVDISEQYARFYDENGNIIWEAPIVSGAPTSGRSTPMGVYDINTKGRHVTLTGRDSAGNITYQTPVAFWMPFIRNSIGFHDATWQSSFGGQRYRQGAGSHGCINLSLSNAENLYGLISVGDVVVVHS